MDLNIKKSRLFRDLGIFIFGFSLFFVRSEPSLFDIATILISIICMRPVLTVLLQPAILIYVLSQFLCLILELFRFGTIAWSAISIYLCLLMILFTAFGRDKHFLRIFVFGAFAASLFTVVTAVMVPDFTYWYGGFRLMGFFKDPNVLSPTSLGMLILSAPVTWVVWLVYPVLIYLALSRATILAFFLSLSLVFFRKWSILILPIALVAIYVSSFHYIDSFLQDLGRGGLVNGYDYDRLHNWLYGFNAWSESIFPLGPTWSEMDGYAMHNTYLRILFEQGIFNFLVFVFFVAYVFFGSKTVYSKIALISMLINGAVVDATHWRILFIIFGICLSERFYRKRLSLSGNAQCKESVSLVSSRTPITR